MLVLVFPSNSNLNHDNIQNFDKHWVQFLKHQYGCPLEEETIDWKNCKPNIGQTNYEEFYKAREMAKKIFELVDPPNTK